MPLQAINDASAHDKMPGIGPHPKNLHAWWARLPLPCARAVLAASLLDDPSSNPNFADASQEEQEQERERLLQLIRATLQKDRQSAARAVELLREEVARSADGDLPSLLDPFCGGGSIPLEGRRLGLGVFAKDLNPVAVLITKASVELLTRFSEHPAVNPKSSAGLTGTGTWSRGAGLAEDVRFYGARIADLLRHDFPAGRSRERSARRFRRLRRPRSRSCQLRCT